MYRIRHLSLFCLFVCCSYIGMWAQTASINKTGSSSVATPWSVKSNLMYDALLMPSLEVEYRFSEQWSVAVEGNMAWWYNDGKHRYYQLATIIPKLAGGSVRRVTGKGIIWDSSEEEVGMTWKMERKAIEVKAVWWVSVTAISSPLDVISLSRPVSV